MAKKRRRLSVKMKRTLRITAAALFLASAVGVALIPQKGAEAEGENPRVSLLSSESDIPKAIPGQDVVYTTGDGMYQFCYLKKGSGDDRVAVIVGYDYMRALPGGQLIIPDTMDAYVKYTHSQGTEGGYVAVGRHGKPLYYPTYKLEKKPVLDDNNQPKLDEDDNPIYEDVAVLDSYLPCLFSSYDTWIHATDMSTCLPSSEMRDPKDFYYQDGSNYVQTTTEATQRLQAAEVAFIANQHVERDDNDEWIILDNAEGEGIFSKARNVTTLVTGNNLLGIGNYSFYNCANLSEIRLGNGANTIGNYAFANCVNLKKADFPSESSIPVLGDHVFYNCRSLEEFMVPVGVTKIGDSAFEGCSSLKHIDLNAGGKEVLLESVGDNIFKNCTSLEELEFPTFYSGETDASHSLNHEFKLNWLDNCVNLKYIKTPNVDLKFTIDATGTYEDFQDMVPKEFYFEAAGGTKGTSDSETHKIATRNNFAFKYLDEERYEKIDGADGSNDTSKQTVFQVNDKNELIYFFMGDNVEKVEIPNEIGPYSIKVLGSDSFQGKHKLKTITIPQNIEEIKKDAFKGCHALTDVVFEKDNNLTKIENGAFATQDVDPSDTCELSATPKLTFTGDAVKGNPIFEYAMDPANKINNSTQPTTYITFYTGWPSNMTVQYNPETKKRELVDYVAAEELERVGLDAFPYMTLNYYNACQGADALFHGTTNQYSDTEDARAVLQAAYNLYLPDGIEAVKEGLISGYKTTPDADGNSVSVGSPDHNLYSFTSDGLVKVDPYMFKDCDNLIGAYINGNTSKLGDYAFENCSGLIDVDIHSELTDFGILPFKNCDKLTGVDFGSNPDFDCADGIIFENNPATHSKILEVLEGRGESFGNGNITKEEMNGVSEMRPEAFKDCEGVMSVDFTDASLTEIPESAFENTPELYSIKLNNGLKAIRKNAFKNSGLRYLEVPNSVNVIDNAAFAKDDGGQRKKITFYCEEGSVADSYASNYDYIDVTVKPIEYEVVFYDEDGKTVLEKLYVKSGDAPKPSVIPTKPGYTFKGWFPELGPIFIDSRFYATYSSEAEVTFSVTFLDWDDSVYSFQTVKVGEDAVAPQFPSREGYNFTGWRPGITNIQKDTVTYAQYEKIVSGGEPGSEPNSEPGSNPGSEPSSNPGSEPVSDGDMKPIQGSSDSTASDNKPNGSTTGGQLYTVIVKDGSGSGSYAAGATVIVSANDAPAGKTFDKWTVDNEKATLASTSIAATTFVMPSSNVTVTANYKDAPANLNNNTSSGSNGGTNSSNTTSTAKPNTTVTITKPGFSNEGLASADVSGSTDNYVLKIADSATAKKEVEDALEALYGSTKNLKYLAMDISLYDSTGQNKIENTDDLKVTVTVPIPDELVPYAGNNRAAYVINGKLVELSPKFTTINGVTCISFVAPHFSPYTIYVDTTNLTATGIQDYTPKTGDGISPKWFLAAALLCISAFLFIKKDKKSVKVKAK